MPIVAVTGLQWGDEGKGKICDILSENANIIVRHIGGNNAGHTVVVDDEKIVLRLIPSGILRKDKLCLLCGGMVVDLDCLYEEIEFLRSRGYKVSPENLKISPRIHIITPVQKAFEAKIEKTLGNDAIGTTMRGIGPTYADRALRIGIRIYDILNGDIEKKMKTLCDVHEIKGLNTLKIAEDINKHIKWLEPFIDEPSHIIRDNLHSANILIEGAHGTLLDLEWGTYPFVTSVNTSVGSVAVSLGIDPRSIKSVIGVFKAYQTRVGNGPFPTEIINDIVNYLRERGNEYGSTTGRPRRCGWLDLNLLRFSIEINGIDKLVVTKFDVLSGLKNYLICDSYELNGSKYNIFEPYNPDLINVVPIYYNFDGFKMDNIGKIKWNNLPDIVSKFINFIESRLRKEIIGISLGTTRNSYIEKYDIWR
ncbi:MAG: adenylosuccinate synthase [bacterium]